MEQGRYPTLPLFLLALLLTSHVDAQNFVINPSFETLSSCPAGPGELDKATPWRDPYLNLVGDTCSSSDLYNVCSPLGGFGVGVPGNILGNEPAHTGNGYAGIIVYEGFALVGCQTLFGSGWREYVEGTLTSPLVAGQTYCISFYISLADNVKFASNNIGVYLSPTLVNISCATVGGPSNLPFTPQLVYSGPDITITNGWQLLQWNYTATGGEQYIIIGNFNDDAGTSFTCVNEPAFNPYAYYYIDDVSVIEDPCCLSDVEPVPPQCIDGAPVTLVPTTPGGTWSGPGIANPSSPSFDPELAGIGTHTILHTISCGTDSVIIVVSSCGTLQVCSNPNGTWTVSNGTGNYTWQQFATIQDCSACFVGCEFPPGCAVNSSAWSTIGTGATITAPTTFPVRVLDDAGGILELSNAAAILPCVACPTITIDVVDQTDVLCFGGNDGTATVLADGGTGPYTYSWSPGGSTGASQSGLSAVAYTVTATDVDNCNGTTVITIGGPQSGPSISITSVTDASCAGNDGVITSATTLGTAPYTYNWSPSGGTGATATGLPAGDYTVTVTDAGGCTAQATASVGTAGGPTITAVVATPSACDEPTGTVTITASGTGLEYSIDGGASFQSSNSFIDLLAGTYDVVVTDVDGCSISDSVTITSLSGPVILQVESSAPSCGQADGSIVVIANGAGLQYSIDGGATFQTSNEFTGLPSGSWTITVSSDGCVVETTVLLGDGDGPDIDPVSTDPLCVGDTNGTLAVQVVGNGPFTYSFDGGANFGSSSTIAGLGAGSYTIVVRDAGGCESVALAELEDPTPLTVSLETTDPGCAGECSGTASATVAGGIAGSGYQFAWPGGTGTPTAPSATDLCAGAFTLQVSDANGCTASADFILVEPEPFTLDTIASFAETCPQACDGILTASSTMAVEWSIGTGPIQSSPNFPGLCPGSYSIVGYDDNGCTATITGVVQPGAPVQASFSTDPTVASVFQPAFTFTNTSTDAVGYSWDFGVFGSSTEEAPILTLPEQATEFTACLTATNAEGCSDTQCVVLVVFAEFAIYVPNTFTPDGDGINDVFFAVGDISLNDDFRLDIFNRWGEEIFTSKDILTGWDGSYQGTKVMDGVYPWRVSVRDPNSAEIRSFVGHVNLLR